MSKAVVVAAAAALMLAGAAAAHDFWLQPVLFNVEPGRPAPITLQIGHGASRERWPGEASRVVQLDSFGPDGRVDQRPFFRPVGGAIDLAPVFTRAGLYVVAMQTSYATSSLPAGRFNDYVREEGLTPILERRGLLDRSPGREIYSRRAKALIHVGPLTGRPDPRASRPLGLRLEIVAERDPYALGPSRQLPVHVLYGGRRLPGALVKLTDLDDDARPREMARTDAAGRAVFRIPKTGRWLLNVIWSEPMEGDPRGDFDTTFSSLTFGFDQLSR